MKHHAHSSTTAMSVHATALTEYRGSGEAYRRSREAQHLVRPLKSLLSPDLSSRATVDRRALARPTFLTRRETPSLQRYQGGPRAVPVAFSCRRSPICSQPDCVIRHTAADDPSPSSCAAVPVLSGTRRLQQATCLCYSITDRRRQTIATKPTTAHLRSSLTRRSAPTATAVATDVGDQLVGRTIRLNSGRHNLPRAVRPSVSRETSRRHRNATDEAET